jgi:MarR family transcriptional regulator, organic hydroperoxide resistance regulator
MSPSALFRAFQELCKHLRNMKDTIQQKGAAAFGTRLRRLSERLDRQVAALYRAHDLGFEPRWYPVVTLLNEHGPLSVGELAALIGITHVAVSQVRGELIRHRIVRAKADKADRRRQILEFTDKGEQLCETLKPIWRAVAQATEALWAEAAPKFLEQLDRIEAALERNPMDARATKLISRRKFSGENHEKSHRR